MHTSCYCLELTLCYKFQVGATDDFAEFDFDDEEEVVTVKKDSEAKSPGILNNTVGILLTAFRLPETSSYRTFSSPLTEWQ